MGIDHYDHTVGLSGACSDAKAVYQHLTNSLAVPNEHIQLLLSESHTVGGACDHRATRENIMSALYGHLRDNPRIPEDGNILIYFAGCGTSYSLQDVFPGMKDTIEALCPADRGPGVGDITDREVSIFLEELRAEKGNNITVIFDCSFTFQAVRSPDYYCHVRSAAPLDEPVGQMLQSVDVDPRRTGSQKAYSMDWKWAREACVLVTACVPGELAQESQLEPLGDWRGDFTRALIDVLGIEGDTTWSTLPTPLREGIPSLSGMRFQHPMIIGSRIGDAVVYTRSSKAILPSGTVPYGAQTALDADELSPRTVL